MNCTEILFVWLWDRLLRGDVDESLNQMKARIHMEVLLVLSRGKMPNVVELDGGM